jgi:16S rRNA (adenine1518-N6/adenine1519-N6)-dimethyltransferase
MTSPITLIKAWNLRPKKGLGQNFLVDQAAAERIAFSAGITPDDVVLEIGAGLGSLTRHLINKAGKVYAVEKDSTLVIHLKNELRAVGGDNYVVVCDDILTMDIGKISVSENRPLLVIGNLPYNISSQILIRLIFLRKYLQKAVLMFQKELAARILAAPGTKAYGRLTVMVRYCAAVNLLTTVKAASFYPKPKVDAAVLEIALHESLQPQAADENLLFKVIKAAFSKRRKTLRNALAGPILGIDTKTAARKLTAAGIDPVRRAETLTVEEFVRLSNNLAENF